MAFKIPFRLSGCTLRTALSPASFASLSCSSLRVEHDRLNRRFTVSPGSGAGPQDQAVLLYRFTADKQVDLMSTFVPETFRGQGVAALLSKAAMDFLAEEDLKARVSCWYIQKFIDEHPQNQYQDLLLND
ncbi:protein NATD1-like [Synchiropus picturatus]